MQERTPVESGHAEQASLENKLAAYYGPRLREQPLPESSWLHVKPYLEPQQPSKHQRLQQWYNRNRRRLRPALIRRRARTRSIPANIRDAFSRLVYESHQPHPLPALYCSFKPGPRVPAARVSPLGRHNIKLILPSGATRALEPSELDVLIATGLARRLYVRKPAAVLLQLLFLSAVLFVCVALILFSAHKTSIFVLLIAILLCAVISGLMHIQGRRRAFQADALMVLWLGRGRACQGLHTLASRSRSRRRGKWAEPSLAERIDRVCGTRVPVEHDRLTLVR